MSKKGWITLLLFVCCLMAATLHVQVEPGPEPILHSPAQLDSLLAQTTYDFRVPAEHIRIQTVRHDSLFQRKNYRIHVPPGFSKTTFHHHLSARVSPLDVSLYGAVQFPERDLILNVLYNNTVFRTITLETDPDLALQSSPIPRLPD
ncbi:hypothetical protein [Rhodohalobacter sp. 8-1]|uniref:hypothetical protein n=1 Tax=Rhodohalobacter sp. 8-1 TaxID=3131972 RepID=UPI0030ED2410